MTDDPDETAGDGSEAARGPDGAGDGGPDGAADDLPIEDAIALAERAARAGGEVATSHFRTAVEVREKDGAMDPVTVADTETQERVLTELRDAGVTAPVVGEESGARKTIPESGRAWVIDPIDGTTNFARGARLWGVCVAVVADGDPVGGVTHLPALGDTYVAGPEGTTRDGAAVSTSDRSEPEGLVVAPLFHLNESDRPEYRRVTDGILEAFGDVRATGSGQTTLTMLADGGTDAVVSTTPISPWDSLVGVSLVRGAGGRVTDVDGERWHPEDASLIATNGACHETVREVVRDVTDG
jgi:myo-inositol-1(or 4)-monophosphatase